MLMWLSLLQMCKLGDSQLRYMYTLWIKENNILPCLMENLLHLMPESVVHLVESNTKKTQEMFSKPPALTFDGWTSDKLGHLCSWVYCSVLRILPALARQWVTDADTKVTSLIDKLTTLFVSPILCAEELDYIKSQEKKFSNMKIHTHSASREVIAVYSLEDCTTELVIQLTHNHPLTPPKVDVSRAMVSTLKTRSFIMQLTIFLTHQNGSIWDGLILWKSNMDKKFEGVEECYICFSILHNSSHQLPKLTCQTCRKKFHSICLVGTRTNNHSISINLGLKKNIYKFQNRINKCFVFSSIHGSQQATNLPVPFAEIYSEL
ncbi:hypothetical protein AAG570_006968 [Ranatra chinensis]|uniref:E3 ubiquitin-protein ligase listerin n=1 Tax=Ranatra chinensis TaxID=642074 RepID=A0ABD0YVL7_9HEMI